MNERRLLRHRAKRQRFLSWATTVMVQPVVRSIYCWGAELELELVQVKPEKNEGIEKDETFDSGAWDMEQG